MPKLPPPLALMPEPEPVFLDYSGADGIDDVLNNLSGIVADGDRLWSVSDERRRVECLERNGTGYRLTRQIKLRDAFPDLPEGEPDLESIDFADGRLWLCGSHTRVRPEGAPTPQIQNRPSRHLLGWLQGARSFALPFDGISSLRHVLGEDAFLEAFIALPSKENGVDIEGMAVLGGRLFLGLRGPVIDNNALVLEIPLSEDAKPKLGRIQRHFLTLGGLGIRDLARDGDRLLVLAGPVTAAAGPFTLHGWTPEAPSTTPVTPAGIGRWREDGAHPEGMCRLERGGRSGLLVVYDSPLPDRITQGRYRADWFPL